MNRDTAKQASPRFPDGHVTWNVRQPVDLDRAVRAAAKVAHRPLVQEITLRMELSLKEHPKL